MYLHRIRAIVAAGLAVLASSHALASGFTGQDGALLEAEGARAPLNHGFKAVQIAVSAWTAEALKLTMPASVFSRSTECHNQDKVSMGTIAARDALRVVELTEQVAAAHLISCAQAIRLRVRQGELSAAAIGAPLGDFLAALEAHIPFIDEDVPLDGVLIALCDAIEKQSLGDLP